MGLISDIRWRGLLQPTFRLPNTCPMALTSASVRRTVQHFLDNGTSHHSAQGGTLWALIGYLQENRIPYQLTAYPGQGYLVSKADPIDG